MTPLLQRLRHADRRTMIVSPLTPRRRSRPSTTIHRQAAGSRTRAGRDGRCRRRTSIKTRTVRTAVALFVATVVAANAVTAAYQRIPVGPGMAETAGTLPPV